MLVTTSLTAAKVGGTPPGVVRLEYFSVVGSWESGSAVAPGGQSASALYITPLSPDCCSSSDGTTWSFTSQGSFEGLEAVSDAMLDPGDENRDEDEGVGVVLEADDVIPTPNS